MLLPSGFQFSQGSLQDYVDCPQRFRLRHLLRLAWPAPPAEPLSLYEQHAQDGEAFHRLVHQHILGLPAGRLSATIGSEQAQLAGWWQSYLDHAPADPGGTRYPELGLSATVGGCRLVAKYDLIAVEPGERAVIVDWKTSTHRLRRETLATRLQTRVYRYLLVEAGAHLNGGRPLRPEQVQMVYWFAGFPDDLETLAYDARQYAGDRAYLAGLVAQVQGCGADDFPPPTDERACAYCSYRSLCDRGVSGGAFGEAVDDLETPDTGIDRFDFEQIAEIGF